MPLTDYEYKQMLSHPSIDHALCCLTSVIGREPVFSAWYDRCQQMFTKFLLFNYSNGCCRKTYLHNRIILYMFSVKMRNFLLFRFHPHVIVLVENNKNKASSFKRLPVDFPSSRGFLPFNGNFEGRNKEYQGRKLVGYSAEQMFNVVADVEKYEKFLPFCKRSHVSFKSPENIKADLVVGFPPLTESYTSNVTLVKPQLIKAVCTEGKLFHYLLTVWKFSPGLKNNEKTCIIDFFVSFEFRSALHSHLANLFFNELVRQMESAFYHEARIRYGRPSVHMETLSVQRKNS